MQIIKVLAVALAMTLNATIAQATDWQPCITIGETKNPHTPKRDFRTGFSGDPAVMAVEFRKIGSGSDIDANRSYTFVDRIKSALSPKLKRMPDDAFFELTSVALDNIYFVIEGDSHQYSQFVPRARAGDSIK